VIVPPRRRGARVVSSSTSADDEHQGGADDQHQHQYCAKPPVALRGESRRSGRSKSDIRCTSIGGESAPGPAASIPAAIWVRLARQQLDARLDQPATASSARRLASSA